MYPSNATDFQKQLIRMDYEEVYELYSSCKISEKEFDIGFSPVWKAMYHASLEVDKKKINISKAD